MVAAVLTLRKEEWSVANRDSSAAWPGPVWTSAVKVWRLKLRKSNATDVLIDFVELDSY